MSHDDVLFGYRLRLFTLAEELQNVSEACRRMGVSRQTYYRLKHQTDRWGIEALRVRERRRPRQPNEIGPHLEQRIVAFSLAHPGMGPRRISAELAREKWGGLRITEHGVWRVLRRVGLNTRTRRLALIARHRDPYERAPSPPERHIDASEPGELVQMDCFFIGRLSGSKGGVWQYTAIDVASAYTWAELHSSERNPRSRHCQSLLHRVAHSSLSPAGSSRRSPPITARNSSRASSGMPSSATEPASGGSRPADRPPTAASSASSRQSSRNAGDRASHARWCPRSPPYAATSTSTSPTTTPTAHTPAATHADASQPRSSTVPARWEPHNQRLSPPTRVSAS